MECFFCHGGGTYCAFDTCVFNEWQLFSEGSNIYRLNVVFDVNIILNGHELSILVFLFLTGQTCKNILICRENL